MDGKRRGPAVNVLSNRLQEDFPSAGTVTQLEMEGWVLGEARDSRLSWGSGTVAAQGACTAGAAGLGGTWGMLLLVRWEGNNGRKGGASCRVGSWGTDVMAQEPFGRFEEDEDYRKVTDLTIWKSPKAVG